MPGYTDEELTAWLLGALDPWRSMALNRVTAQSPALAHRVEALAARLGSSSPQPEEPTSWRLPPPGIRGGPVTPRHAVRPVPILDAGQGPRPFDVKMEDLPDAQDRQVVVLCRQEGQWSVLFPTCPDEETRLGDLPLGPDRTRVLSLTLSPGRSRRWAVALVSDPVRPDWQAPPVGRWETLRQALYENRVPVFAFDVPQGDPSGQANS